jgi:hypothetical protein
MFDPQKHLNFYTGPKAFSKKGTGLPEETGIFPIAAS